MAEVEPTLSPLDEKVSYSVVELEDVSANLSADFIVIPGGDCYEAVNHSGLHQLIQKINSDNALIAGICNGAVVLASAGVLKNRKCTHTAHPKYAPLPEFKELLDFSGKVFADSIYVDEDVVIDGNIITAKPRAANEFAKAIVAKLI